jgi:hypothetical protein
VRRGQQRRIPRGWASCCFFCATAGTTSSLPTLRATCNSRQMRFASNAWSAKLQNQSPAVDGLLGDGPSPHGQPGRDGEGVKASVTNPGAVEGGGVGAAREGNGRHALALELSVAEELHRGLRGGSGAPAWLSGNKQYIINSCSRLANARERVQGLCTVTESAS